MHINVPEKGILERTPRADEFVTKAIPEDILCCYDRTFHTYSVGNKPVQELGSYKPTQNCPYASYQLDYNGSGQVIRTITGDEHFPIQEIHEYKYKDGKLITDTSYQTMDGYAWKHVKTINPEDGSYKLEYMRHDKPYKIEYHNADNQLTKKTNISYLDDLNPGREIGRHTEIYEPSTRKLAGLVDEFKYPEGDIHTQTCTINPENNKITKFEIKYSNPDKGDDIVEEMFERNEDGKITHFKNMWGYEYRLDSQTNEATMTNLRENKTRKAEIFDVYDFIEDLKKSSRINKEIRELI